MKERYSFVLFFWLNVLTSLLIVFFSELIARQSFFDVVDWIGENLPLFLTASLFIFMLLLFIGFITGKIFISFLILQTVVFLLSTVNYLKVSQRNEVFYLNDLSLTFSIGGVVDKSNISVTFLIYFLLFLTIIIGIGIFFVEKKYRSISLGSRIFCVLFSLILANIIFTTSFLKTNVWDDISYKSKGFVLGFVSHGLYESKAEFMNYNKIFLDNAIFDLKDRVQKKTENSQDIELLNLEKEESPNVVVILSESFFDITKIGNLKLSKDPIPNFREYSKKYTSGDLGSMTYGGGTANVEYEILTGFLNKYFFADHSSYETYIKEPINALPNIFKTNNYETKAVHTYNKNFYSRDTYYDKLGFDEFTALEDMENPEYSGTYVSDDYFADQLIEAYENKKSKLFLFGISMENHQPYDNKYENTEIKILNDDISENSKNVGENYIQGLYNADKSLKKIIDYFEKEDEKTIVLFFGDHLPNLGKSFSFYRELGFIKDDSKLDTEDLVKIVTPPFLIYSNYGLPKENIDIMGSNFMGNYILNLTGLKKPLFFHFIDEVYEKANYMSRVDLFIDKNNVYDDIYPYNFLETDDRYKMFQYDILIGNGYVANELEKLY